MLGNERTGLHRGELAQILVVMASADLDEEDKGFRLVVELLLQDSGGLLKVSLGGYMRGSARRTWASTLQDELTIQDNLQLLQESLLIHDGRGNVEDFRVILFFLSFNSFSCPSLYQRLRSQEQGLSSLSRTNNSKGVSQSNIDRKKKKEREEEDEEKKKERRVVGEREKKREEEKKKFRGVGWCRIGFSAGTVVNTREIWAEISFNFIYIGLYWVIIGLYLVELY